MLDNSHRYEHLLHLPHPDPVTHPRMPMEKRAAQFAPFAALSGYEDSVAEEARITEEKSELSEDMKDMLDAKLAVIGYHIKEQPDISVTYFIPDERKAGGRYVTVSGSAASLDGIRHAIIMTDGTAIPIDDIRLIEGRLFDVYEQY